MTQFRLYAPFARCTSDSVLDFYGGDFLEALLLYDQVFLDSAHYLEFFHLARRFGLKSVLALLDQGIIIPHLDDGAAGQVGQTGPARLPANKVILPILHFEIVELLVVDYEKFLHQTIKKQIGFNAAEKRELANMLRGKQHLRNHDARRKTIANWKELVEPTSDTFRDAFSRSLDSLGLLAPRYEQIQAEAVFYNETDLRVESNIRQLIPNLTIEEEHRAIERALLSLRKSVQVKCTADELKSIPAWQEDLGLLGLEDKRTSRNPTLLTNRLHQILEIREFPKLQILYDDPDFKLEEILKIRNTRECQEFRACIRSFDRIDQQQWLITSEDLKQKVFELKRSLVGKTGSLLFSVVSNLIPPLFSMPMALGNSVKENFFENHEPPIQGANAFLNTKLSKLYNKDYGDELSKKRGGKNSKTIDLVG